MSEALTSPPWRETRAALLLAALAAALFVGAAILPTRMLAPFPPEVMQPARDAVLARGERTPEELLVGNPQMGDKLTLMLAWDRILATRLRAGELPLWTRDIAGGMPMVPLMAQVYQPWNLLLLVVPAAGVYGIWYFLHLVVFAGLGYRFLRRIRASHLAALTGMLVLELGFWTQARVHHNVILTAALPAFAILGAVHHIVAHRGGAGSVAVLALGTALTWLSGFAPVSVQISYVAAGYAVYLVATTAGRPWRRLGPVASGMALGVLVAAAQILPTLYAAQVTSRQPGELAMLEHVGLEWDHLLTAVWPTLFEWPAPVFHGTPEAVRPAWAALALLERQLTGAGFNFPETAFYCGVLALALAGAGAATLRRDRDTRFFLGVAVLGLAVALAIPGVLHAATLLPGTTAGDIKRFLFLVQLGAPVLVARGVDAVQARGVRAGGIVCAVVAGASLVMAALHLAPPSALQDVYGSMAEATLRLPAGTMEQWVADYPDEGAVNRARLLGGFAHAAIAGAVGLVLLLRGLRAAWPVLIAADLLLAGAGTRVAVPIERIERPPAILAPVLAATARAEAAHAPRPRVHRIMAPADARCLFVPLLPNYGAFFGIEDAGAYCSLPKARMDEFFTAIEPSEPDKIDVAFGGTGVYAFRRPASLRHPLLDVFGVEWVLAAGAVDDPRLTDRTPEGLPDSFRLYRRAGALPRATFVTRVEVVPERGARLRRLADPTRDARSAVVLEAPDAPIPVPAAGDAPTVRVVRHADEAVEVEVETGAAGYLRLADPFDAGWTARVDGRPARVFVADHYLRAVYLEPGRHVVRFAYDGPSVVWPIRLSLAGLLVWLGVAGRALWRRRNARTAQPSRPSADRSAPAVNEAGR